MNFRFDAAEHTYLDIDTGEEFPHITAMLKACGYVDDAWFTDASRERGQAIHRLTADYDIGALEDLTSLEDNPFKGWLLAHVDAMQILQPTIYEIETPHVHPIFRFGGRPDRELMLYGIKGVLDLKSGPVEPSHRLQTALQAILAEESLGIPPEMMGRWTIYLKRNGKWKIEQHHDRTDFDHARTIIKRCCAGAAVERRASC